MDDAAKKAKLHIDVPWDDVRAARVQKGALEAFREAQRQDDEAEEAATKALPAKAPASRRWVVVAALVAAAAALVLWLRQPTLVEQAGTTWAAVSTISYADGSRSLLSEHAQLHVIEDASERVRVRQDAGKVRYDIVPRPERSFEVGVLGVRVTVLGTVFDVEVNEAKVKVAVTRGRVKVEHGERTVVLTAGETVTIDADGVTASNDEAAKADDDGNEQVEPEEPTEAVDEAPAPSSEAAAKEEAAELMRRADSARASGRLDEAVSTLHELIKRHPRDQRVVLALFTLGKVERQRGNHGASAQAFERCGLALKGDALAEAASSWKAAGQADRARAAAQRYLQAFPDGVHAASMKTLAPSQP